MPNTEQMYPDHIRGYVVDASDRFPGEADDYHRYYQVVCPCGHSVFRVYIGDKDSVKAQCAACQTDVILYDLSQYPAATKLPGPEEFKPVQLDGNQDASKAFVMYEYGELDEDMEFDPNAISWFQLWLENEQGLLKLMFDDESA